MLYDDLVFPHGGVGVELADDEAGATAVPGVGEADHIRRLRRGHDGLRRGGGRHRQHAMAWRCSSVTGSQPGRRGEGASAGASAPAQRGLEQVTVTGTRTFERAIFGSPPLPLPLLGVRHDIGNN